MDIQSPYAIEPRYVAECKSFARNGNMTRSFDLRGHTAADIVSQFESLRLAEAELGYEAYLPRQVYEMAAYEASQ